MLTARRAGARRANDYGLDWLPLLELLLPLELPLLLSLEPLLLGGVMLLVDELLELLSRLLPLELEPLVLPPGVVALPLELGVWLWSRLLVLDCDCELVPVLLFSEPELVLEPLFIVPLVLPDSLEVPVP